MIYMETIDTNVDNYTLTELMLIVDIDDLDEDLIVEKTGFYIDKFKKTDPKLSAFFKKVQGIP